MTKKPRGIRLNNPGNIERNKTAWRGMSKEQDDPRFVRFETPAWGIRAMMKILLTYYRTHELRTVQEIIGRWAPPSENNTAAYASHVARVLGVSPFQAINVEDRLTLVKLAKAISVHENGRPPPGAPQYWFDSGIFMTAAKDALL